MEASVDSAKESKEDYRKDVLSAVSLHVIKTSITDYL